MRHTIETAANVMVTCAAAAVIAAHVHSWLSAPAGSAPEATDTYVSGQAIEGWAETQRTLFLFVSTRCRFCTASLPFYARLASALNPDGPVRLVFGSREPIEALEMYLKEHGIDRSLVISMPPGFAPKLRRTPTILLVDERGRVEHAWHGQLSPVAEREVLAAATLARRGSQRDFIGAETAQISAKLSSQRGDGRAVSIAPVRQIVLLLNGERSPRGKSPKRAEDIGQRLQCGCPWVERR